MRKKYLYAILFGIPGLVVAFLCAFFATGFSGGILWLFVFGDTTWPHWTENILRAIFLTIFIIVWATSLALGYKYGKSLSGSGKNGLRDLIYSIGITLLILSVTLAYLFRDEIGPRTLTEQCIDVCKERGYTGSMMPPSNSGDTTCSCFDEEMNGFIEVLELTN